MTHLLTGPVILAAATLLITASTSQAQDTPPRPAKYEVPFSAPQNYLDHAAYFVEQRLQIGSHPIYDYASPRADNTTSQFGNIIVIEGKESLVVIDTSISQDIARTVLKDVRSRTDKPVEAVIYTHHHGDHINGASAFIGDNKNMKIIAADNFVAELASENHATGPLMALRAAYMYGKVQTPTERSQYHVGCCGFDITGNNGFIEPNLLLPRDRPTELTLAGEKFIFFATGGESASHLAIYMPERDVLFSGDELQGPTFPQLHSLRGTKPRDVIKWINAIDKMRSYKVAHLVPSHGLPLNDANEIERVLTTYRDAMQYVHDQTVRLINMGYTPDDIAENMKALPADLQLEPWTIEYYGNVDVSARNIYGGYISWWNGDPAELRPTPRLEKAQRIVALMGGRDPVFKAAEDAFSSNDPQWAAELATLLIRINRGDWDARYLKAAALRQLGYKETSSSTKGFYLGGALELEGKVNPIAIQDRLKKSLFNVERLSTHLVLGNLRYQVNPTRAAGKRLSLAYRFCDTNEVFSLFMRHGVLEIQPTLSSKTDAQLEMTRGFANRIWTGQTSYASGIANGDIKLTGDIQAVEAFYAALDTPEDLANPYMVLR